MPLAWIISVHYFNKYLSWLESCMRDSQFNEKFSHQLQNLAHENINFPKNALSHFHFYWHKLDELRPKQ